MRKLYTLGLAIILLALFAPAARAEGPGTLEGKVTNRSLGGGSVQGLGVILRSSDGGADRKAISDTEGVFRFDGLAASAVSYTVSLNYAGIDYNSPAVAFGAGESTKNIDVPVYESSDDISTIKADVAHIILDIDPSQEVIGVTEFLALSNTSDKAYAGKRSAQSGERETLRFPVPDGAVHLQAIDDYSQVKLTALPNGAGFADAAPFAPGTREVAYSYMQVYRDNSIALQRPIIFDTAKLNLLVSDTGAKVTVPGFAASPQPVDFEGNKYLVLSGTNLKSGQNVQIELSGLQSSGNAAQGVNGNLKMGAIILVPLAIGLLLVLFLRNRRNGMQPVPAAISASDDKVQLIRSMVELDNSFERGRIPEDEYRRLRADIKRRLADLW